MNNIVIFIAIVLLPGLVASILCEKIVVHTKKWDQFKFYIYSFVFGAFSYTLMTGICVANNFSWEHIGYKVTIIPDELSIWNTIKNQEIKINWQDVLLTTFIAAPAVAIFSSWIVNKKIINSAARKIGISNKYGDENLFSFFLTMSDVNWVYVRDKEAGLTFFGHVVSYSESDSLQELLLSDVTVYEYEHSEELYHVKTIYLSKPLGRFVIEVPDERKKEDLHDEETG